MTRPSMKAIQNPNVRLLVLLAIAAGLLYTVLQEHSLDESADLAVPRASRRIASRTSIGSGSEVLAAIAPGGASTPERPWPGTADIIVDPFNPLGADAKTPTPPTTSSSSAARSPAKVASSAPSAPPAPPTAPALPFQAVGLIAGPGVTGGAPTAFLQEHDQVLLVKAGDTIAGTYHVDSVTSQQIELTYLPLKQKQTLRLQP